MDIKCKNCGQMIDENDKYCKYCGYLIPPKEKEIPLSKKALDDKIQESKATITEDDLAGSDSWALEDLAVVNVGDRSSLYSRSILYTILLAILFVGCFAGAFLSKIMIENKTIALCCLIIFIFAMLVSFGFVIERYFNTKGLKDLEADEIVVRKYGFKKPAEILIDGHVFELVLSKSCPDCEGEIIGDLHFERIEKKLVVVCNINRKHCYTINEKEFVEALRGGKVKIITNKKSADL